MYDAIIDDERRENAFGLLMSLNMLVETREGYDYAGRDCRGWMAAAGVPARERARNPWWSPLSNAVIK